MVLGGINKSIKEHARNSNDWVHQDKADKAYTLYDSINENLYNNGLPEIVIGFDDRLKKAGEYYFEGDNISLKHHFDIRTDLTPIELVIAVLHNAIHAYTDIHKGKGGWWHMSAFKKEIQQYGITVQDNGDLKDIDVDIFGDVMDRIGMGSVRADLIDFEVVEAIPKPEEKSSTLLSQYSKTKITTAKPKGTSKMKKWSCSCPLPTNVRCATNLTAYCHTCMADFELQE